jgi:cytochrome P450
VLTYTQVLAGAGNETTGRMIGWLGKVLGEHPDQRRELASDPRLIPQAVEETFRFEPTGPHLARYVARDVEYYGRTVPEGSAMLLLVGAANRDERRYQDPDRFDIHRGDGQHLTFGFGVHFCLGASLARLESRVALEEVLKRFPDWEIDYANARMAPTSTVRGWESMPVFVR